MKEGNVFSRAANNWLSNYINTVKEDIRYDTPVFESSAYQRGENPFGKEFWATALPEGLSFVASMFTSAGLVRGVGQKLATRLASKFAKDVAKGGMTYLDDAINVGGRASKISSAGKIGDFAAYMGFSTLTEAMYEAKDMYDSILDNQYLKEKYTPEQLVQLAEEKAADSAKLNMMMLGVTNAAEAATMFRIAKAFTKFGKAASRTNKALDYVNGKASPKQISWWEGPTPKVIREIGGNILAEGLEENLQYNIQSTALFDAYDYGPGQSFLDTLGHIVKNLNYTTDFTDNERLQSTALGAMLGGGHASLSQVPYLSKIVGVEETIHQEHKRKIAENTQLANNVNESTDAFLSTGIYQREQDRSVELSVNENGEYVVKDGPTTKTVNQDEFVQLAKKLGVSETEGGNGIIKGAVKVDKDNNPVINYEAVERMVKHNSKQAGLLQAIEQLETQAEGPAKDILIKILERQLSSNMALEHFRAGLGDVLFEKLDNYSSFDYQDGDSVMGRGETGEITTRINEAKEHAKELEKLFNNIDEAVLAPGYDKETVKNNEERKDYLFSIGERILTLDSLIREQFNTLLNTDLSGLSEEAAQAQAELSALYGQIKVGKFESINRAEALNKAEEKLYAALAKDSETSKNANDLLSIRQAALTAKQLAGVRNQLAHEYLMVSDIKTMSAQLEDTVEPILANKIARSTGKFDQKGYWYFVNNKESLLKAKDQKRVPSIIIDENTSLDNYETWEQDQLVDLRLKSRLDQALQQYYGQVIRDTLHNNPDDLQRPISDLIDSLIEKKARLTEEDLAALADVFNTVFSEVIATNQQIKDTEKELARLEDKLNDEQVKGTDMPSVMAYINDLIDDGLMSMERLNSVEEMSSDTFNKFKRSQERIDELEAEKLAIEDTLAKLIERRDNYGNDKNLQNVDKFNNAEDGFIAILRNINKFNYAQFEDADFKRIIVDNNFINSADVVISNFEESTDYDDIDSVDSAIAILTGIKRIFNQRPALLSETAFDNFIEGINDKLQRLKEIQDIVDQRLNDRLRKERQANEEKEKQDR